MIVRAVRSALIAAALAGAATPATAATNIWSTDFENGDFFTQLGPFEWWNLYVSNPDTLVTRPTGTAPGLGADYLSSDTTATTSFVVEGLGAHTSLSLSFDLIFVDSWDGLDGTPSPDLLFLTVDGAPYLTLSSNNTSGSAAQYGPGSVIASGSLLRNPSFNDVVVHYDLVIPHSAADFAFQIAAGGAGFQGGDDESWGIDNFSLGATVPEPASWAMMIGGFGLTGTMLRRRRTVPA